MRAVRSLGSLVAGWGAASFVAFMTIAAWTYARGGALHRTPVCCGNDENVFAAAFLACAIGFIPAGLWWALGATSVGWRWARLGLVAAGTVLVLGAAAVATVPFHPSCMCAPG
jgi:hypothetical protein